MKQIRVRIGDIFAANIDDAFIKFFQYVENDFTQLNSCVIRVFKKQYAIADNYDLNEIVKDKVEFYAHTIIRLGYKMSLWDKIGNNAEIGKVEILFRDTNDYGSKPGEQIAVSHNWYVWKINEEFKKVGKLQGENQKAEIGVVVSPLDIIERMRNGQYNFVYPGY